MLQHQHAPGEQRARLVRVERFPVVGANVKRAQNGSLLL